MPDREDLNRLVGRMVDRPAYHHDPIYKSQVAHLKHLLRAVEAAMQDEDVDATVIWRVLSRVATGGVPSPYEAYERMRTTPDLLEQARLGLPPIDLGDGRKGLLAGFLVKDDVVGTAPSSVNPGWVDCPTCLALIDNPCADVLPGFWHVRRIEAARAVREQMLERNKPIPPA